MVVQLVFEYTDRTQGRVNSFYGAELTRYTSWRGHPPAEGRVKQILCNDRGVISLSARSVHLAIRRGLTQWHLSSDKFQSLECMSFTAKKDEVLVAGNQNTMFRIDVDKGTIVEELSCEEGYTIMKRGGQYICAATTTGSINLLDPNNFTVVKSWRAHTGWINDMDVKSDFLVTCGFSLRQQMGYMLDPLANVYDLKTLAPLPPIPFQPGCAFVRMHPKMSTTAVVASQTGQLQVVDLMNPNTVQIRQVNVFDSNYITFLEMAPSGEAIALCDAMCNIHLWGSPLKISFTEYAQQTEFPDQVMPPPPIDWSPETYVPEISSLHDLALFLYLRDELTPDSPLSTVGMPYYRDMLLSAWPSHMVFEVGAPPPKIDAAILNNLQRGEMGGWCANPNRGKILRNQVQNTRRSTSGNGALTAPKFLSEKAREGSGSEDSGRRMSDALEAFVDMSLNDATRKDVPVMYRNVEIKYSKFGVDDFDFE